MSFQLDKLGQIYVKWYIKTSRQRAHCALYVQKICTTKWCSSLLKSGVSENTRKAKCCSDQTFFQNTVCIFWRASTDLIFVMNITNYIRGEISAFHVWQLWGNWKFHHMWRNFGISWEILGNFGKFCHNLHAFMWRKIEPKSTFVEKKWQIWGL